MRSPDLYIGPKDDPQTLRWHLFRWRGWQIALHKWLRPDNAIVAPLAAEFIEAYRDVTGV